MTVNLYDLEGTTPLLTTTTDANGNYYFPVSAYSGYVVRLDNPSDYSTGPLKGYTLTSANQDAANMVDSKALLPTPGSAIGTSNYPEMTVGSHIPGQNDTTFDAGFIPPPDAALAKTLVEDTTYQVGNTVTYNLAVSTSSSGGPVYAPAQLTVTDPLPAGFSNLSVSGTNWDATIDNTTSPATMTAIYTGPTPIPPGTSLPAITLTGTLTAQAVGSLSNTATLDLPGDSNPTNNTSTATI